MEGFAKMLTLSKSPHSYRSRILTFHSVSNRCRTKALKHSNAAEFGLLKKERKKERKKGRKNQTN